MDLRNKSAKGLISLVKFYPGCFTGQFETASVMCMKMMEENPSVLAGTLLGEILCVQIDPRLSGAHFSSSHKVLEQFPKTLAEVNFFLVQYMSRAVSIDAKIGLLIAGDLAYERFLKASLHSSHECTQLMEGLLLICARSWTTDFDSWWCGEAISWLGVRLFASTSHAQSLQVLDYLLTKLASLRQVTSGPAPTESESYRTAEFMTSACLKLFALAMEKLLESEIIARVAEPHMPIFARLTQPKLQMQAVWTTGALVKRCPSLILSLLSQMITNTTIAYAELEGLRTQYFSRETYSENSSNLIGHCSCLATLIKALPGSLRGVPIEETEIAFNTVKNMVSGGEYQGDVIDEDKMFAAEQNDQDIDNAIRYAAWIIVDGLLHLGPEWVGSRLTFLFKLWKLPFGNKTCVFDQMPQHWVIGEILHKKVASSAMLSFLKYNKSLLQPQVFKLITVYLTNVLQFLCPLKNSTQRRQFLEQNCSPSTLTQLKKNIYECILYMPSSFISGKIAMILNPICSEVVNERANSMSLYYYYTTRRNSRPSAMMSLSEQWLSSEDGYLIYQRPLHYLHSLSLVGNEAQHESWIGNEDLSQPFCEMLGSALRIFSEIFTNSALNASNRQKLFQYLSQHLGTALKNKESGNKSNKTCNILLAVLGCLRNLSLSRGIITDLSLMTCIRTMLSGAENISQPLIKCIFAESMIYLCKVMADPQHIPVFMKEIEHRILLSENNAVIKSGIVMLVGNMYKHFDIAILEKNQDALGHIIQSISRDQSAGAWALHALYKAYSSHGNRVENIFKATFPLGYHHYLNDYNSDFQFKDTMMLLSQKHLLLNSNPLDAFYLRSRLVWEDTWEQSEFGYDCVVKMLGQSAFNAQGVIDLAVSKIPDKAAVVFLTKTSMKELSALKLLKIFKHFDEATDEEQENALLKIAEFLIDKDPEAIGVLKQIILSTEVVQEEEVKGMSALNDRDSEQKSFEFFSQKSKKLAIELLITSISENPGKYKNQIEEYINFAIHLTSFSDILSVKGFQLAITIFKVLSI